MLRLILERTVHSVPIESIYRMALQVREAHIAAMETGEELESALSGSALVAVEMMLGNWDNALYLANWVDEKLSDLLKENRFFGWAHVPIAFLVASLAGILGGRPNCGGPHWRRHGRHGPCGEGLGFPYWFDGTYGAVASHCVCGKWVA